MKDENIYNFLLNTRCIKREFNHQDKKFKVYVIKDSYARSKPPRSIIVDDRFFKEYNKNEQLAVFYHEAYHNKITTIFKKIINLLRFFSFKKASWNEEFNADKFAAKNIGKSPTISFLEKSKKFYINGSTKYNPKTHPTLEERIIKIKELKGEE